jgi:protein-tyrosine phosphatase
MDRNGNEKDGTGPMYQVLMVCTGNICRSPMAAGLARFLLSNDLRARVAVGSAGCSALHGHLAESHAIEAMSRMGIDISGHRARQITSDMARQADLILTMEAGQRDIVRRMLLWKKNKVRLFSGFCPEIQGSDIKDPYGGPLEAFQECLNTLLPCMGYLMNFLETQVDGSSSQQ